MRINFSAIILLQHCNLHLYASVRHFYDPLALVKPYLTDQFWAHGVLYEAPGIDAKTWGLDHTDNPFSFKIGRAHV